MTRRPLPLLGAVTAATAAVALAGCGAPQATPAPPAASSAPSETSSSPTPSAPTLDTATGSADVSGPVTGERGVADALAKARAWGRAHPSYVATATDGSSVVMVDGPRQTFAVTGPGHSEAPPQLKGMVVGRRSYVLDSPGFFRVETLTAAKADEVRSLDRWLTRLDGADVSTHHGAITLRKGRDTAVVDEKTGRLVEATNDEGRRFRFEFTRPDLPDAPSGKQLVN